MNILLTGAVKYTDEQLKKIEKTGFSITFVQDEREPLDIDCSAFDAVVCNSLFLYTPIEKFTSLKFIQLTSAGLDRAPLDYIKEHNIQLCNARGVYSVPMAEWVLLMTLSIYKRFAVFSENQRQHFWNKQRDLFEISGKNVCVVGCGSVGMECLKRFKAFDAVTIGVDIENCKLPYVDCFYNIGHIDEALKKSDIVVLTLPLTDKTRGLFDKEKFSFMKRDSVLINVARGGIINESDLISELKNGKFKGVALDVFEEEPLKENSPLWDFENVIITPHNSFVSENNIQRLNNLIVKNLNAFIMRSQGD